MKRIEAKRKKPPSSNGVEPEPPALVKHLAWFGKNWRSQKTLIAAAAFVAAAYGGGSWWLEQSHSLLGDLDGRSELPRDADQDRGALRVAFSDGTIGYVAFSYTFAADPSKVVAIVSSYGDQKNAVADLETAVVSAAYKALEVVTIDQARRDRARIELTILQMTKEAQERTGHNIQQISLLGIEPAR